MSVWRRPSEPVTVETDACVNVAAGASVVRVVVTVGGTAPVGGVRGGLVVIEEALCLGQVCGVFISSE